MVIVVDAYNVLKKERGSQYITSRERTLFIEKLNEYARIKKHTVIVVFDGGDFHWPARIKEGLVSVIYSGDRYTADEVIKTLASSLPGDSLLVSSDRALCNYALNYKIHSLDPEEFNEHWLAAILGKKAERTVTRSVGMPIKYIHEEELEEEIDTGSSAIDDLMQKAAQVVWVKDKRISQETNESAEKHKKPSRREKRLERLKRKL